MVQKCHPRRARADLSGFRQTDQAEIAAGRRDEPVVHLPLSVSPRDTATDTLSVNIRLACVSVAILTLAFANLSAAQEHVGIRVGISGDPDQFVFGGHIETAPLMDRLVFRPNAEIGLGSDLVLMAFNLEFAYKIPLEDSPWTILRRGGSRPEHFELQGRR